MIRMVQANDGEIYGWRSNPRYRSLLDIVRIFFVSNIDGLVLFFIALFSDMETWRPSLPMGGNLKSADMIKTKLTM